MTGTTRTRQRTRGRTAQEATMDTTVEHRRSGEKVGGSERHETANTETTSPHPARVCVGGSATINMGDYNSVRCEVRIDMPCEPTDEAVDACYAAVSAKVEEKLQIELDAATGASSADNHNPL